MIFRGRMGHLRYCGLALGRINLVTLWFSPWELLPQVTWWRRSFPCHD